MFRALEYASAAVIAGFVAMLLFSGSVAEQVVGIDKLARTIEQLDK